MKTPLVLNRSPRYLGCVFARTVGWGMDDNVMVRNESFLDMCIRDQWDFTDSLEQ